MRTFYDHQTNEMGIFLDAHDYAHVDMLISLGLFLAHNDHLTDWHNEVWAPAIQRSLDKIPEDKRMDAEREAEQDAAMAVIAAAFGFEQSYADDYHPEPPC